ncbi:pectate lyase [Flavobacterium cheongpyeongense]|uniref:Pectate lyase n=1 Tax=Flavobacterium cheongpyeongense TaxID=2212651 RepID=A0A2V4BUJ4_9FLAO|nr:pectate lyase [Flavobacterium cheongpyeongense]PXY42706.1 pectate lyase [Flavobacterium cheongpyeongense]
MNQLKKTALLLLLITSCYINAQEKAKKWPDLIVKSYSAWFGSEEGKKIGENVLLYQRDIGGWPKNIPMLNELTEEEKAKLLALKSSGKDCTIDNRATTQEILFVSKMYAQTNDERYKDSFLRAIDYLLSAQYPNGGWPQYFPLKKGYYSHITYNDNSMVDVLNVLKEIANETPYYSIKPSKEVVDKAKIAVNKGIECILKTQYKQNGVLTVWCAQHDEVTFAPADARAYELASLSGKESAKVTLFLMSVDNPSPEIKTAVKSAYDWFEKTKITNLKEERIYDENGKVIGKKMYPMEDVAPIWPRFAELDTNEAFFCDRDGIKKKYITDIGEERRNGYSWYSNEPKEVLKKYKKWAKKNDVERSETE